MLQSLCRLYCRNRLDLNQVIERVLAMISCSVRQACRRGCQPFTSSGFSTALAEGLDCAIRKHTILNDRAEPARSPVLLGAAAGGDRAYLGEAS